MKIALVGCVKTKKQTRAPARELYVSPLFQKAVSYAEHFCDKYFILSAKYGLIEPTKVIGPYNVTLKDMSASARKVWSFMAAQSLARRSLPDDEIVFLCGLTYREYLSVLVNNKVSCPIQGLKMGQQESFYNQKLREANVSGYRI